MSYNQNIVSEGLDKMPLNKRFKVPNGALPFIEAHMRLLAWDGGIHLNHDKSEFYKTELPIIKKI